MGTRLYPLPGGDGDGDRTKFWYPLGLGMGMGMVFLCGDEYGIAELIPAPPRCHPYVALLTPSLAVSLVEDQPLLPERNTSTISNPLTILLIPITYAACLPSPSRTTTSTASITNKTTPWSSLSKSKTTQSRKSLSTRATPLASSTG